MPPPTPPAPAAVSHTPCRTNRRGRIRSAERRCAQQCPPSGSSCLTRSLRWVGSLTSCASLWCRRQRLGVCRVQSRFDAQFSHLHRVEFRKHAAHVAVQGGRPPQQFLVECGKAGLSLVREAKDRVCCLGDPLEAKAPVSLKSIADGVEGRSVVCPFNLRFENALRVVSQVVAANRSEHGHDCVAWPCKVEGV